MLEAPQGPIPDSPLARPFWKVFEDSHQLLDRLKPAASPQQGDGANGVLLTLTSMQRGTTQAARLLLSWGAHLPGLALARIRLEAAIVCSYLIHESDPAPLARFVSFGPIGEYRLSSAITADPHLRTHVAGKVDLAKLRLEAGAVEASFDPGFDITRGKFTPKWTSLDLLSMAQRRDTLANSSGYLTSAFPLASLYNSIYRTASSYIHSDASIVGAPFYGDLPRQAGPPMPAATFWALTLPTFISTCDFVQCYEVLRRVGVRADKEFLAIATTLT